jgi:uncharacterized protein with HEPN domain
MNETDRVRLQHMLDYAREVVQFTQDKTRQNLDEDVLLMRGICMSIGIIGEAASHISSETCRAHAEVVWSKIVGMRNFLFHAYMYHDPDVVWVTATQNVPPLIAQLEAILLPEEGEGE